MHTSFLIRNKNAKRTIQIEDRIMEVFREAIRRVKNSHFPIVSSSAVILASLIFYWQDFSILFNEALQSDLASHILVMPFLLAYLVYRKRKMLRAVVSLDSSTHTRRDVLIREIVGAMLCFLAFFLYWHGSRTFYPLEYHMVSLPLFVTGCILLLFNTETLKVLALPIAFLLFLIPPPFQTVYAAGTTLSTFSSQAAYNVLKTIGLPVSLETQYETSLIILGKPEGTPLTFAINIACAGIYSLIGYTIFATFVAYITRGNIWKKTTVFFIGFPLIYALNIIRIIITVMIGNQYGMDAAVQTFHLLGGPVLIFLGTLILILSSEKILKIRISTTKPKPTTCPNCDQDVKKNRNFCVACGKLLKYINVNISKRTLLKTVALLVGISFIVNLQVPVFALTEGPAQVFIQSAKGEQPATTQVFPQIPNYTLQFLYRDEKFEEIAQRDLALVYAYIPTNQSGKTIWVALEIGRSQSVYHAWEGSLITWPQVQGQQPIAKQLDLRDVELLQNPPIIGRFFAFQPTGSDDAIQVILYWFENAFVDTGSSVEPKYVKMSLIAFTKNPDGYAKVEDMLLPFGKIIINHWQPVKAWPSIVMFIASQGNVFIPLIITLLAIILTIQILLKQKQKESNLQAYNKLRLKDEKLILLAVHQATQKDKPVGNTIASAYHKLAGKTIEIDLLHSKLEEAEEVGFVKKDVINQGDEPIIVWKSLIPFP